MIALTFIPNPENKETVNHKDGNKLNNVVSNLEWNTNLENIQHSWETGLRDTDKMKMIGRGEKNSQAIINESIVKEIRKLFKDLTEKTITNFATEFKADIDKIKEVINFKDSKISRYHIETGIGGRKFCCRDAASNIRNRLKNILHNEKIIISKKYNISIPTVSDIIAYRSWNYENL